MARSGSDRRQRQATLSARFNSQEAEAIRQMADRAGLPVAALIRTALLNPASPPLRTRRPTVNHQAAARLLGELGRIAQVFREAGADARIDLDDPRISAALRDLAEMRTVCFEAMGRDP